MNIKVTKRNGSQELFDIEKIRQVIEWSCEGLDVNPLALESKFDEFLYSGITTKQIQNNLTQHAKAMANPHQPDWVYVAGRLLTMDLWADTMSYELPFLELFKEQVSLGIWKHENFSMYTDEQIELAGSWIVKERDLDHSVSSVISALSKYLLPNECIQHMFMGEALIIASVEKEDVRMQKVFEIYEAISCRKLSLATPWLINLRSGGNISSCFIIQPDDSLKSLSKNFSDVGSISKEAGGLGFSLARVRARGSWLMGSPNLSGGVVPWIKIVNDYAVAVNQGGKRKGAVTVALPIWHADISEFLDLQTESGDQRTKAYDVKPQISVPDLFMELKDDPEAKWLTFCPYEVEAVLGLNLPELFCDDFRKAYAHCVKAFESGKLKVCREFKAKELWVKVLKTAFETGMPYVAFTDEINRKNPNNHIGVIPCVNLCVESFSVVKPDELSHTCNLASLVLGRIEVGEIEYYARLATRILANGILLTKSPIEESNAHNSLLRTVGVGIQGYADLIAREWKSYLDTNFAQEVAEKVQMGCLKESIQLSKERGAYPAFQGSRWSTGELLESYIENSVGLKHEWKQIAEDIQQYGLHCSQHTSPAPNTTTSIFMDAAASVLPVYSAFFYEDNTDGKVPISSMYLKENPISYGQDITKFRPWDITKVIGAFQKYFDTGISAEYIMDKNQEGFNAKWLWDTYQQAWANKTKAVYYIRTIKKGDPLVKGSVDCVSCAD